MADSPAERARRARRHRKGDHSLCDPARRCDLADQAAANEAVAAAETRPGGRYGPRGQALHDALAGEPWVGPMQRALLDEACRVADRLDRLDAALTDKGTWLRYERSDQPGEVVITIDSVLSETRQQEMAFRALIAELDKAATRTAKPGAGPMRPSKKGGGLVDLRERAARRAGAAG
ncbi:hypothetical protein [Pseudonocardia sp. NPDC049635]|uniref:hypothetical protein n=1 Tax=Pseudonocardia sp. NPDC049635 TaxID=3155506 RepID=UPI0033D223B8